MSRSARHLYEFGPFHLDATEHVLLRDGEPVSLTPKAFDTLLALVQNPGHLVGKDELMKMVWPDTVVDGLRSIPGWIVFARTQGSPACCDEPGSHREI